VPGWLDRYPKIKEFLPEKAIWRVLLDIELRFVDVASTDEVLIYLKGLQEMQ
jgi:hypothetical protein